MQKLVNDHIIDITKEKNKTYISIDFKPRVEVKNGDKFAISRIVETSKWEMLKGLISGKIILRQDARD